MQKWIWLAASLATVTLLYLLAPILPPFLLGILIAYMGTPLVSYLQKLWLPKIVAVILVILFFILVLPSLLLLLTPIILQQVQTLLQQLPSMLSWLQQHFLPFLQSHIDVTNIVDQDMVKQKLLNNLGQAGNLALLLWQTLSKSVFTLINTLANILLTAVVAFYLLRDWKGILHKIKNLLPAKHKATILQILQQCHEVLAAFLRGQLLVMLGLGIIYSIGLYLSGLNYGVLIGSLAGLISIVPYLGFIVGIVVALLAALIQFHELMPFVYIVLTFGIGQAAESMLLTPVFVGERIGLHPVVVIFAILAGGQLFGLVGILLALPVAAVITTAANYLFTQHKDGSRAQSLELPD
jgi:predicted PurR-regulated permease PerM